MKHLVLDTHTLVWYLEDNPKLSKTCKSEIENPSNRVIISVAVLLEIKYLHGKKRFTTSPDEVIEHLENDPRCVIYPVDLNVLTELPTTLELHDAVIVATAKIFEKYRKADGEVFVLTKDREITKSGIINTLW